MGIDWETILGAEGNDLDCAYIENIRDNPDIPDWEGYWYNPDTQTYYRDEEEPTERHTTSHADNGYATGTWNGKTVKFKKVWGGHTFTEAEIKKLLAGEEIEFPVTNLEESM